MNRETNVLRYALIILPALIAIYVYDYADYELFTLHFLLLLLIVTLGGRLPGFLPALAGAVELLYTAWLCGQYGELMIFPAVSALIYYSRLERRPVAFVFLILHLAALNAAFIGSTPRVTAYMNLTFLLSAALNRLLLKSGRGRADTLFLYDELRKKHFELEEARSRLLQFNSQIEAAAQAEERVRIARQLHDDIGHRLIRVKMMTEAAIHTLPHSPETGMDMMSQIRDQLAASMDDMRTAVRRINHAPQLEGAYALDRLLEELGRDTGIDTSYQVHGMPYPLYPSVQVTLFKNAREALTNALRHGHATAVWIKMCFSEHEMVMEVGNNGEQPEENPLLSRLRGKGGMGLQGMSERTRWVGGTLELRLDPEFTVITRVPLLSQPRERPL
ncbi:sensor histidine kinase [Paenibacillus sp. S150]|uniref:sensor histidine kinase n=1 Tax=Paenibacillus sp. S150 TaxID=2749826 RepID=UPI001C56054C|nr:histidine kinase [Paenibacillus sp. S150]MBW4081619.1 sensor histidine kinase [Paenibacillus sp. S150]